jgi:hypothetical protein
MKKLTLLLSLALVAGLVYAQAPPPPPQPPQDQQPMAQQPQDQPAGKTEMTKQVEAEIIAVDTTKKTLTIKRAGEPDNQTVNVEGKAVAALKDVRTGQKYTLVCKNDTSGGVKSVVDIKTGPSTKPEEPR